MASPTLHVLRQALAALYGSHDAAERRAADDWLQQFMHGGAAWGVALELLAAGDPGEQLYSARVLHVLLRTCVVKAEKRQASHVVLTAGEWQQMLSALSHLLIRYSAAGAPGRPVLTQVALALSALLIKWDAVAPEALVLHAAQAAGYAPGGSAAALVAVLRVLPEECTARELSIHPARRAAVADALRAAAPAVLATLDAAAGATVDDASHALCLDALGAWCEFGAPTAAVAASTLVAAAFQMLAAGGPPSLLQPATGAASGATGALLASAGADGPAALTPLLRALRPAAAAAPADSPAGAAVAALLGHAAAEAAPRAARGDAAAAALLAEAMDAMLDAVAHAPGPFPEPPLAWLTPWASARDACAAVASREGASALAAVLSPTSARLAALTCARTALPLDATADAEADDATVTAVRADFADALRDAVALTGAAPLLPPLRAALRDALSAASWQAAEAAATAAAVVCRSLPPENADGGAEELCAAAAALLAPPAAHARCAVAAAGLLGALGPWLSNAAPPGAAAAAAEALERGMHSADTSVARAASIAFMRAADSGAAARFAAAGATQRLAALLAAGGPTAPPPGALRVGQEPVATVVLRAAARLAAHVPPAVDTLAALLLRPLAAVQTALARLPPPELQQQHAAQTADAHAALAVALRDVTVLLEAAARCSGTDTLASLLPHTWPALAAAAAPGAAAAHAGAATELCAALWVVILKTPESTAAGEAMAAATAAFCAGGQPAFLTLLQRCVSSRAGGGDGAAAASAALRAAEAALAGGSGAARAAGAPLLRLLGACVAAQALPLTQPAALSAIAAAAASCLSLTSGDDARAACELAASLLASPLLLAQPAAAEADACAVSLVHALLCAANGALPPSHVTDTADSLHAAWRAAGDARFAMWLAAALADPTLPRPGTPPKLKAEFAAALTERINADDPRRFKRLVKGFCGGKKKGAA